MNNFLVKHETNPLNKEFICGFISAEGCFSIVYHKRQSRFVPVFEVRVHFKNREILELIRDGIGLEEHRIHEYKRGKTHYLGLIIRRRSAIQDILIPYFTNYLHGAKKDQFEEWKNFIGIMYNLRKMVTNGLK